MMSGYTHETDAHLSVYVRVDVITMCSANHSALKQGNACWKRLHNVLIAARWLAQTVQNIGNARRVFFRVPHLLGDRASFESRPETVGWLR
ncbi:predicted protein [Micromonas commoda]|uniref:Uncharacterized protein n=1 Tax=Micromonas commoda (strain RCC299 / NOUM17 / CCMP2709) TaxID=296587 RepID=C1EJJ2_MICCC|nr:predicted protein [Micromonas commoda]ACO68241.1 predicted protein [Micromonas commoda]|eukprot:XP_002506983.1 predicted protein [Micromonas commoda]